MDNKFPKLNLEQFAHGYRAFFDASYVLFKESEGSRILPYILTEDINAQYMYSDEKRNGYSSMDFLKRNYLTGEQEIFLQFFNEVLPNILIYLG
ncbi:MAG: hypothetical protein K2P31_03195, partial [Rickettsiaceae bacterium]|nr:hypothetical protein [Rickettsiaceae bacterium]